MKRKIIAFLMVFVFVISMGYGAIPEAKAGVSNLIVTDPNTTKVVLTPGTVTKVTIPLKARTEEIILPEFLVEADLDAPFSIADVRLYREGQLDPNYVEVSLTEKTYLEFNIATKDTAKKGKYPIHIDYIDYFYTEEEMQDDPGITIMAEVKKEKMQADLTISEVLSKDLLKPGKNASITFMLKNEGELPALNTCLSVNYAGTNLIPQYTDYDINIGTIQAGATKKVTLDVLVLESMSQDMIELPIELTYQDSDGVVAPTNSKNRLYLFVELPEQTLKEDDGSILVNGVSQSSTKPRAGEKLTVSFHLENTSTNDYTDVKLYPKYVSGTGFEPINGEPYQYVGTLKAGERKKVSVTVLVGEKISAGMNMFDVGYSYVSFDKQEKERNVSLYILNVVEKEDSKEELVVSKPKLMVSDFQTSLEEIKTGEQFDFTFHVLNTHEDICAKNIKVTVTSSNFAVTSGSNSFFVSEILPNEKAELTINLKASAALTTGGYPLSIMMEYEYEGMPASAEFADGVRVTEEKILTVKENLRVSVENISAGDWDIPIVNQETTLSFEVYNMGKSQLNNVYFTLEGDFAIANGSSYYYGTLNAGYPDYVEMSVIPNAVGNINGVLVIHMEDSNGDEVEYRKEFTSTVQEEAVYEWNEDMYMEDMNTMPVISEEVKEPLLPWWAFLLIEAVVFVGAVLITRSVVLRSYRKKQEKENID